MDPLGARSVGIEIRGERLLLLPDRAVFWPEKRTLVVADIHFGKAATFRHHGMAVPEGGTATDLERLSLLLKNTGANRIIIVGDLIHAPAAKTPHIQSAVANWRKQHRLPEIVLVSGNHDRASGQIPDNWDWEITCAGGAYEVPPLSFVHDPSDARQARGAGHVCGHLHPAVSLSEGRLRSLKAPCFWLRNALQQLVLPGFGSFTGSKPVAPQKSDRIFALTGAEVREIPPTLFANRTK